MDASIRSPYISFEFDQLRNIVINKLILTLKDDCCEDIYTKLASKLLRVFLIITDDKKAYYHDLRYEILPVLDNHARRYISILPSSFTLDIISSNTLCIDYCDETGNNVSLLDMCRHIKINIIINERDF